ncbi:MAG: hypothetical protein EA420_00800 [Candidatus Competibacteraceae bacterium]|nr:MAG: hypothetical protein EA420_00800 [Candidatus Competibacteraceae bacterium]
MFKPEPRFNNDREARLAQLRPIPHSPESMDGIPYFDEEFQMAASDAHRKTIYFLGALLDRVAERAGLRGVSDYPIWYWVPELGEQRILYPDYALTANPDIRSLTAKELVFALEVVTTSRREKELKDTVRMREHNRVHGIPEFLLVYPEPDDERSVIWHRYDARTDQYHPIPLPADRRYRSRAVPGLDIEVLEPSAWTEGRKLRVYYQSEELREGQVEEQARKAAEQQAAQERQAKEQERQARMSAEHRAEQERQAKEQERQARTSAEQQVEQLLGRLRQAGLEP